MVPERLAALVLALVLSPLLPSLVVRVKAFFGGRQGMPLLQPYLDLWKLLRKGTVLSRTATSLFRLGPIVALAAIVAFFPIFSGAVTGLKSADPDLERLFDLYAATPLQRLTRLRLPAAVPFLLEGHKVAAGLAIIGAVVAEFVAGSGGAQGLAWRILEAGNRLQTARMFAALAVLGLLGALLHAVFDRLEKAGLRWWRGR